MCIFNKDNEKHRENWYNADQVDYFRMLGMVQRLTTVGLMARIDDGIIHQDCRDIAYKLEMFFEDIEQALKDRRIQAPTGLMFPT